MSCFVHCLHGLTVVGEADLAFVIVKMLVSCGPGFENVFPCFLYNDCGDLSAGKGLRRV